MTASFSGLPVELQQSILRHTTSQVPVYQGTISRHFDNEIVPSPSLATLTQVALLNKHFRIVTRPLLLHHVRLVSASQAKSFLNLLDSHPGLGELCRVLDVGVNEQLRITEQRVPENLCLGGFPWQVKEGSSLTESTR